MTAKHSIISGDYWKSEEDLSELLLIPTSSNTSFDQTDNIMRKEKKTGVL